MGKMIKNNSTW